MDSSTERSNSFSQGRKQSKWPDRLALSREQFSKDGIAEQFAKSKVHADKEFLDKIVILAKLGPESSVLDIATGTGFVAVEFAHKTTGVVVGSDITLEMVGWARKHASKEGTTRNTMFLLADAAHQPFRDQSFDSVVSRLAMHHIPEPVPVIKEMARLCKPDGRAVVADQISPEDEGAAKFHDEFEKYRDPSHEGALRLSEFRKAFQEAGLKVKERKFSPVLLQLQDWATRTGCDAEKIVVLRRMMLSADPKYRRAFSIKEEDGHVWFRLQRVILSAARAS